MVLELEQKDIKTIGNTAYANNGMLTIMCNGVTYKLEELLLRSILKCFGEEYHITNTYDYDFDDADTDIVIETNLPFNIYMNV